MRFYSIISFFSATKKYRILLCSIFFLMSIVTSAQVSEKKIVDKLLPLFKEQMRFSKPTGKGLYTVAVTDLQQFEKLLQKNKSVKLICTYAPAKIVVIECSWSDLEKIIADAIVLAVDATKKAKEDALVAGRICVFIQPV